MLGKLLRNEFKNTYKTMLVFYLSAIVSTILGCVLFRLDPLPQKSEATKNLINILEITFMLSYFIVVILLVLITYILMCERFYKSMYSDQGYLTHTLPVSPLSNLNARLITSLVWLLLSGIVLILSIFSLTISSFSGGFYETLRSMSYRGLDRFCMGYFGWHFPATLLILLLFIITACLNALLLIFAALSLGQLANLHKIRAAVGIGVAFGFLEQIVGTIVMIKVSGTTVSVTSDMSFEQIQASIITTSQHMIWVMIAMFSVFAAVYYAVCAVITKKHVNLA